MSFSGQSTSTYVDFDCSTSSVYATEDLRRSNFTQARTQALTLPVVRTPAWLDNTYELVARNRDDEALDVVFDEIHRLLSKASFKECDSGLAMVDVSKLSPTLITGVLSITLQAKAKLHQRAAFFERSRRQLHIVEPKNVAALLDGLA
jgi:hypothetical protein